ncbi:MAG: site-specific integrase [Candidatus Competibacteraceae bacterium]
MSTKITKRSVDAAKPPDTGQIFLWDSELPGFGLRVTPTRKTYIVQSRVAGKTVRTTIGTHGALTPDQARREAMKLLGEMAKGVNLNQAEKEAKLKGITLAEAFHDYLQSRTLTANTLRGYHRAMDKIFADWRDMPLTAINRTMIERRFDQLSERSEAQANQQFRFLRALLNFAMEKYSAADGEPLIPSNPCNRLTALKKWHRIDRRTRYIEPQQLKVWFAALEHQPDDTEHRNTIRDYCAFILLTGCREQEAARLTWDDVNLSNRTVTFRLTKNHRVHNLPIGTWLAGLLERRQAARNSAFVFPANNRDGHLKYHRKGVLAIANASGVEFRLHDLRRSFATIVSHHLERSMSAYTIKRLLNHSSGADVTQGDVQFGIEDLREPMQAVETFVLKCAGLEKTATVTRIVAKDDCYFDPEDLDKFIPPERYLSFQQLVERWKVKKDDIVAFIKEKATKSRESLDSSFVPYLFPHHPSYRRDTPIEGCGFALSDREACERKWFPASIVHDAEGNPGGDRVGAVNNSPTAPNPEPDRSAIKL